ncbi:dTMP kinase [Candidatus Peregrinibacteria bacterium]|jgi:dTMP kinase|nr:dTMP kinase [Candidatus Peregrinibacteria bacterium]MBT3598451.1 dTMP kinase [Candidatus Peregrinibacteria bacterium]MBT4367112.1 dTMP kinase [Candidatus Peregrinibacteria bacterium]MBT4585464.1 dTMP kinase [Candidatus Peregrinibacteria bacterium]MBT6730880.1 dTMP kinase [Candidatus Peregrinibacteria bacterium]
MQQKGKFIVLEGPDGSGTTLHSRLLSEYLESIGKEVVLTREPTDRPIGSMIRTMLKDRKEIEPSTLQLLFCADRSDHVENIVLPALEQSKIVISDRYTLSTIIYGTTLGLNRDWLKSVNSIFPVPDLTLIALPPLSVCLERINRRENQDPLETNTIQESVHSGYSNINNQNTFTVDTTGGKEEVSQMIISHVKKRFPELD